MACLLIALSARAENASERALKQYEARNAELSTPAAQPYATPYFTSNERGAEKFYRRFAGAGGVMVGVGFQQNFTYLAQGRASLYVFFDINPDVTGILLPFFGVTMAESPTRREFLAALTGVPWTEGDVERLVRRPVGESKGSYLAGTVAGMLDRAPREDRRRNFEERIGRILARREVTPAHRIQVLQWFDLIEEDMLSGGKFFEDAADDDGWLSREESYRFVRRSWLNGRIIGVTGDIGGPSVGKLAQRLRERGRTRQVTFLYLSNVGASVMGHEKPEYFAEMYRTLGQLPLSGRAVTLIAQGNNIAYLRTFARARKFYESLAGMDAAVMSRLVEIPLSYSVTGGVENALTRFKQEAAALTGEPSYSTLLDRVIAAQARIRGLSPGAFEDWAKAEWPGRDLQSDVFRALVAVLVELGVLGQ